MRGTLEPLLSLTVVWLTLHMGHHTDRGGLGETLRLKGSLVSGSLLGQ